MTQQTTTNHPTETLVPCEGGCGNHLIHNTTARYPDGSPVTDLPTWCPPCGNKRFLGLS